MKNRIIWSGLAGLSVLVGVPLLIKLSFFITLNLFNMEASQDIKELLASFSVVFGLIGAGIASVVVFTEWEKIIRD